MKLSTKNHPKETFKVLKRDILWELKSPSISVCNGAEDGYDSIHLRLTIREVSILFRPITLKLRW